MTSLKYQKPDLVWYAAYDEDINSKLFIEKLLKIGENIESLLPQKIIPTVMLGWKLKLNFEKAHLVEDKDKMALIKLHLISRRCLLALFEVKNGKKVPLTAQKGGDYLTSSIKKVNFNKIVAITTF